LSGQLINWPIEVGFVPEQPFIKIKKKKNEAEKFPNCTNLSFRIRIFFSFVNIIYII
jgi:hypothetical protein